MQALDAMMPKSVVTKTIEMTIATSLLRKGSTFVDAVTRLIDALKPHQLAAKLSLFRHAERFLYGQVH